MKKGKYGVLFVFSMKFILFFAFLLCFGMTLNAQVVPGIPDDLVECDVNNPGDQTEVFDLTETEATIINGQSNVVVTYHLTSGAALSNINPIPNPETYTNISNPEPIFARLQSTAGQGWSVVSFSLIVPLIAEVQNPPQDILVNDGDGNAQAIFDLTLNEGTVLGNQDPFNFQFSYYETLSDAEAYTNAIAAPESYQNTINPQTIYGRIDPLQLGCQYTLFQFAIQADGPLSTSENRFKNDFFLFPNPVASDLTIVSELMDSEVEIQIYNVSGKLVFSNKRNSSEGKFTVNLNDLQTGMYFVEITSEGHTHTQQFIKK